MANVVLTTVVADQPVARTQSPEAVAKMARASDVVVVLQVSRQLLTPRDRSLTTDPKKIAHSAWQGKGSNCPRRKRSSSLNWKIHEPCIV